MDFELSDEQNLVRETIRDFMRREFPRERVRQLDEAGAFPEREFLKQMGELGFLGLPFSSRYGGSDGTPLDGTILMEEMGRVTTAAAAAYNHAAGFGARAIYLNGTEEQKQRFLPRVCRGEVVFALGLTEPNAGSDARSLTTTARAQGDSFVINGAKMFTSGAGTADYIMLAARTDPAAPSGKG
ncbi:MAG: acyl-CoA dehydrogenase family protein, partial [Chloroflexi bacterium]|nr:acyl-CoA dehydrogenase family protein [Chloroflexota bacterium]